MNYEIVSAKTCPYVQRVMILLEEKGIEYTHSTSGAMTISPALS